MLTTLDKTKDESRLRQQFDKEGFAVIPRLLSASQVAQYRLAIQQISGLSDSDFGDQSFACADAFSKHEQFWPLISCPELVETVRIIVGSDARYTHHSDIHVHRGAKGQHWHRDGACRQFNQGPDWEVRLGRYAVVRVAIYLQSYSESGSALGVLPGSHLWESPITGVEKRFWGHVNRLASIGNKVFQRSAERIESPRPPMIRTRRPAIPFWTKPTAPVWIKTEPGDCIIFDQRLYHCPSKIRGPKYAMYLSYGADNEHSRNHLRYYHFQRKDLGYEPIPGKLERVLQEHGLFMPLPEDKLLVENGSNGNQAQIESEAIS